MMKKRTLAIPYWYDQLINHILNPIQRQQEDLRNKIMSLLKMKSIKEDAKKKKNIKKLHDKS